MTSRVQELIDKIKTEGVEAAQSEASQIKQNAQEEADKIIQDAKNQATQILNEAKQEIKKTEESAHMSLKQASRDMVLSLRKNIESILTRLIKEDVSATLKPDQLAKVITQVVDKAFDQKMEITSIEVVVSKNDLEQLKKSLLAKLQKKIKEPIHFKSSDEISGGFTISFDEGKSSFDFTDESLAQYLSIFLNNQVSAIVKESV